MEGRSQSMQDSRILMGSCAEVLSWAGWKPERVIGSPFTHYTEVVLSSSRLIREDRKWNKPPYEF